MWPPEGSISRGAPWHDRGAIVSSERRACPTVVADLARQKLTVAGARKKLAVIDHDLATQDRHARPGRDLVAFPRAVVGLVQLLFAQYPSQPRVEQYDVGVGADRK